MSNLDWKEELLSAAPIDLGPSQVLALQVFCIEALNEIKRLKAEYLEAYSHLDDININLNEQITKLKAEVYNLKTTQKDENE